MNTKVCTKCGRELPLSEFGKYKASPDGYFRSCKECINAYNRLNHATHKEERNKRQRERGRQPDIKKKKAEYAKKCKEQNPEEIRSKNLIAVYKSNLKHKQKHKARYKLSNAIKEGKIKRLPCEVCGDINSEGHHYDYNNPLDVKWLCRKHHAEEHSRLFDLGNGDI